MRKAGIVAQWTENGMTDLLAAPDGGLIKWVKDRTMKIVEEKRTQVRGAWLDNNDRNSKSIRRIVSVNAVAQVWKEFRVNSDFIMAVRTGNLFALKADRSSQFDGVNLRGFVDEDGKPTNRFAGKRFEEPFNEYKARQKARKKDQKDRQKKKCCKPAETI